jgi:ubiquinone/menaquinone biosynthesis C-methylase UbiE
MIPPLDEYAINNHYGHGSLWTAIRTTLTDMGKELQRLTVDDLASVDAFHIRGRTATVELAERLGIRRNLKVLDVGCGLGGSVRYLASAYGCKTTGIDLTKEYIEVARLLAHAVGLDDLVAFHHGSALDMPFEDGAFDIVWTEHAQMNIEDKRCFYREIARVLKPKGRLVFHDVFNGIGGEPHYPVPWAENAKISFLVTIDHLYGYLKDAGFSIQYWEDKSQDSLNWFNTTVKRMKSSESAPLGVHLLMGQTAKKKFENLMCNLSEQRITVLQAVMQKTTLDNGPLY